MKTIIANTHAWKGGAAKAASRLHTDLLEHNIDSSLLHIPNDFSHRLQSKFNSLLYKLAKKDQAVSFSTQYSFYSLPKAFSDPQTDLINLHWICDGFIGIENMEKITKPIVWTMHDMWPFTGGCHQAGDCKEFQNQCKKCPLLHEYLDFSLSALVHKRKQKKWNRNNITVVSPSNWLSHKAKQSSLFKNKRIEVIPNGIDLKAFQVIDQKEARQYLSIDPSKNIILFSGVASTDIPDKGFYLLVKSLEQLSGCLNFELHIAGTDKLKIETNFPIKNHGLISDEKKLNLFYSAGDILAFPSKKENLPCTIMESMAAGTPCISFNVGGIPDMVKHQETGYLVNPFNIDEFTQGIQWLIEDKARLKELSINARKKIETSFAQEQQTKKYIQLFDELIRDNRKP